MSNTKRVSTPPRVLVVGDEETTLRFLRTALAVGEFSLQQTESGPAALAAATAFRPEIILLDLGAFDSGGVETIRRIRECSQAPIIALSAREGEDGTVEALDAGANDYLIIPFGDAELLARIRVALKRSLRQAPDELLSGHGLEVDLTRRRAAWLGREVRLNPTEYDLLRLMVSHAGKTLSQGQILSQVWGAASNSNLIWSNRSQCFRVRL